MNILIQRIKRLIKLTKQALEKRPKNETNKARSDEMEAIRGKIDLKLRGFRELANAGETESMEPAAAIDTSNSDAEQELIQATDTECENF